MARLLAWGAAAALCMLVAVRFVGAQEPAAPSIPGVVAGDTALTVKWSAPAGVDAGAIVAYDLRYIASDAADKADDNWAVIDDAWTSGPLHHLLAGLVNGTGYDVQVRAETTSEGAWSSSSTGTPADHGDSAATATALDFGVPMGASVSSDADKDYFEVVVTEETEVLLYTTGELELGGSLLTSSGELLHEADPEESLTGPDNFAVWGNVPLGTYRLLVTGTGPAGSTGSYVVHSKSIVDSTGFADAHAVDVDSVAYGILDNGWSIDDDYFKLDLSAQTDLLIFTESGEDTVGIVYTAGDGAPEEVASNDDGYLVSSRNFVIRVRLPAGTHYIQVQNYSRSHRGPYRLLVREVVEPGSTVGTASSLAVGDVAAGVVATASDVDYFRIEVEEPSLLEVRGTSDDAELRGTLLDSLGVSLGASASASVSESLYAVRYRFSFFRTLGVGTYYLKVDTGEASAGARTGAYAVAVLEDPDYGELLASCGAGDASVSDPLYGCQWNLDNTGQVDGSAGEDINVFDAWNTAMGDGVAVAVVDTSADPAHEDLWDNFDTSNSHDYTGGDELLSAPHYHGTAVAGIVAARDNIMGIRGVAPRATVRGLNLLDSFSLLNEADAMTRGAETVAVSNNSWGIPDGPTAGRASRLWERAVEFGLGNGYSGLGTFYAFAAGNGAHRGDDSNLDEMANFYGVAAVCAVNHLGVKSYYSEKGANLWVCAPSSDAGTGPDLASTGTNGSYTDSFGGTSGAAPQVSGVAALARSANNTLSWRDVKLILAGSARKNDAGDAGWRTGAAKYEAASENYEFNHSYGFGVVDAAAALELAEDWTNVPEMTSQTVASSHEPVTVELSGATVERRATVGEEVQFVEFVEVSVVIDAPYLRRHLTVDLVSPSGAVSKMLVPCACYGGGSLSADGGPFRLGSARHLGEDPQGEWTLRASNNVWPGSLTTGDDATLHSWSITVYGHRSTPGPPTIGSVSSAGASLTLDWDAPQSVGRSPVTGYDVRYIDSGASGKDDDSSWDVSTGVWSSGSLSYTVTGLVADTMYDFQVRAVSDTGNGAWSATFTAELGETEGAPRFPSSEDGSRSIAENTAAGTDIGAALAAEDDDGDAITYRVAGYDAAAFDIDPSTGQLRTKDALDRETQDVYDFTVIAEDGSGLSGRLDATVTVTDVNEPPVVFGSGVSTFTEEPPGDYSFVLRYSYSDPEGDELDWSLSGPDSDYLVLNEIGYISWFFGIFGPFVDLEFAISPDYEDPVDFDENNVYEVTLSASDGDNTVSLDIEVTVIDKNEPPELSGPEEVSFAEGGTGEVARYEAEDPEGKPVRWTVSYQDRDAFTIVGGVLKFKEPPDYEDPDDIGWVSPALVSVADDNVYDMAVWAWDEVIASLLSVTVTVTNVDEAGTVSLSESPPVRGMELTASLSDPDEDVSGLGWSWQRSDDGSVWAAVPGAGADSYTPVAGDLNHFLRATAVYSDGHGSGKTARAETADRVADRPPVNGSPQFPTTAAVRRTVAENTASGAGVGAPVAATDPDGDSLMYSLGGAHAASFEIVESSGQILTKAALNYEGVASYSLVVSVHDGTDGDGNPDPTVDDEVDVEVEVTDVDEAPTLTGDTEADFREGALGEVARFAADDPEGRSVAFSLSEDDAGLFRITSGGVLTFRSSPDFEDPRDSNRDNRYRMRVTATDRSNSVGRDVTVSVTNRDERGSVTVSSPQPQEGTALTATVSDPDRMTSPVAWAWERSDGANWIVMDGADSAGYTPIGDDVGRLLRITASYDDGHGRDKAAQWTADAPVQGAPVVNHAPQFPSSETGQRSVAENHLPGREVGAALEAADENDDQLTYSLHGSEAASFAIDHLSGQLSTAAGLDHEDKPTHRFVVRAADPSGEFDEITVTVTVTNGDDPGTVGLPLRQPQAGVQISAELSDPDGSVSDVSWVWERSPDTVDWTEIDGADTPRYTPTEADIGQQLRVVAAYTDAHGPAKTARGLAAGLVLKADDQTTITTTTTGGGGGGSVGGGGGGGGGGSVGGGQCRRRWRCRRRLPGAGAGGVQ